MSFLTSPINLPLLQVKTDMDFEIVSKEECSLTGDREEMYSKLEQDLIGQVKMCMNNRTYFKEVGDVQRADVIYGEDNRSKGFGTICFATKEEAEAAIEKFHDSEVDGRTISVRIDQYA